MSSLGRKLRRDLAASKGMLLAIIAIIAVGGGCLVGMTATFANLETARDRYYSSCRMADFWIELKKAPLAAIADLGRIPASPNYAAESSFRDCRPRSGSEPISGLVLSLPDHAGPVINNIVLRSGRYFTPERRNEVIVSEKFAGRTSWCRAPDSI